MKLFFPVFFLALQVMAVNYVSESFAVKEGGVPSRLPKCRSALIFEKPYERTVNANGQWFAEVFFRPMEPRKNMRKGYRLMSLSVGGQMLDVRLADWELQLLCDGKRIASYPASQLCDYPGMSANAAWHHLLFAATERELRLFFDGFLVARMEGSTGETWRGRPRPRGMCASPLSCQGPLTSISIGGGSPAGFADLRVSEGDVGNEQAVRRRFLLLYQGKIPFPVSHPVASVPRISGKVTLESLLDGKYVKEMTSIPLNSISHLAPDHCDSGDVFAYIGRDDSTLYLLVETLYRGKLHTSHWNRLDAPIWNEEAWEWFLRPVESTFQLLGNPSGDLTDLRNGDTSWNSGARYLARTDSDRWRAAWAVPLASPEKANGALDDGLYRPAPDAAWGMNLFNSKALMGWNRHFPYFDPVGFGTLRFDDAAPAIRIGKLVVENGKLRCILECTGAAEPAAIDATVSVWRYGEISPESVSKSLKFDAGKIATCELEFEVAQLPVTVELTVKCRGQVIFRRCGHLPGRTDRQRRP